MTRSPIRCSLPRSYPVHEAKAKLSEILRRVKQGHSVTISERGRVIARVVPIERAWDLPTRLRRMNEVLREGRLRGADLCHLACALYLAGEDRGALTFLSRDAPQRDLARRPGFATP